MNQTPRSDQQLLQDFAIGRRDALAELASRHERSLLGLACGLLGGRRALAQDAVQETWVRVVRFAGGFKGQSSVRTWLCRILINQCRTLCESERLTNLPAETEKSGIEFKPTASAATSDIDAFEAAAG